MKNKKNNKTKSNYKLRGRRLSLFTLLLAVLTILGSCSKDDDDIPPNVSITITFDTDGGSAIEPITVTAGVKVTAPTPPTKAGFTFKEWQLEGTVYDFNLATTKNITVKAIWTTNTYTVTFDTNGGSAVTAQTVAYGNKATKPNPTKATYTLKEWQLDGKAYDFNTAITQNITLKAVWTINNYTVTFDTDGGSAIETQTIDYNSKATKPATDPTKTGYLFAEWQVDGTVFDFNTAITVAITLKAKWELNGSSTDWTIDTDADGNATIRKYNKTTTAEIVIPKFVDGKKVISIRGVIGIGIFGQTFESRNSSITSLDLSNAIYLTLIKDYAFAYLTGITSIIIPNSVTSIGDSAFPYCTTVTSITIPTSVTSIKNAAFAACSALTSIIIPASVTIIENGIFFNCSALTSVTLKRVAPLTTLGGTSVFSNTPMADASKESTFYYPSTADYQNATNWTAYKATSTWTAQE